MNMSKKIKIEIDLKDIDKILGEHINKISYSFFNSSLFTQKVAEAVNAKLDDFAFLQRIIYDARFQEDVEKIVKKLVITSELIPSAKQELDPDRILTVLRNYDPDVLLKLIYQIKSERE